MVHLLELPQECLFEIFRDTSHRDLVRLRQCCKGLNERICNDYLLYKVMYLDQWDEPPPKSELHGEQWRLVGDRFAKMIHALKQPSDTTPDPPWASSKSPTPCTSESQEDEAKPAQQHIAETILEFLKAANSKGGSECRNADILAELFKSEANLDNFLGHSSTFLRSRGALKSNNRTLRSTRIPSNELSAKLHCLYGTPLFKDWYQEQSVYPYACSRTYDLRNYQESNRWGPFQDDGSLQVDWEKVQSAMVIVGANVKRYRDGIYRIMPNLWKAPFDGAWQDSYRVVPADMHKMPFIRPLSPSLQLAAPPVSDDPYGITGTWMRIVCFLDYQDLSRFNFSEEQPADNEPRPPINIREAMRIITMQIVATDIEPPGEADGQELPVVHFKGISQATHHSLDSNAKSKIRGTVSLTKEGEVRWTSYSVYYGEERWKSEGVQVGGLRSGRGVFGHWFDRNYDPHGPAGPTGFWKISDDYDCEDPHGAKRRRSPDGFSSEEDDADDLDFEIETPNAE